MTNPSSRAAPVKPGKPYPSFPLSAHVNGQWYKTKVIGGRKRFFYFGPWATDPRGNAAHQAYLRVAKELHVARLPAAAPPDPDAVTAEELVNRYLAFAEARTPKEIGYREFGDVRLACLIHFLDAVGELTPAPELTTPDVGDKRSRSPLQKFRDYLDGRMKTAAFNRNMQKVRSMLRWSYHTAKLLRVPIHEDVVLKKKKAKLQKRERRLRDRAQGCPVFTPNECHRIVLAAGADAARGSPILAMILLAMNSGWGQSQLADLPDSTPEIDLSTGIVDWVRVKTEEITQFPLWPVTVWAIQNYLPHRPSATQPDDAGLMFVTKYGHRWVREIVKRDKDGLICDVNPDDAIGKEFEKIQKRLGIKRRGRGFNAFRHTFSTTANETLDKDAIRRVMGHGLEGMDPHYLRGHFAISLERLRRVTEHVGYSLLGGIAVSSNWPRPEPAAPDVPRESPEPSDSHGTPARRTGPADKAA